MKRYIDIHSHTPCPDAETWTLLNIHQHFETTHIYDTCSVGLHPWYPDTATLETFRRSAGLPHVLAIGECGLDTQSTTPMALQTTLFQKQIALANQLGKPLIIHCVRAFQQTIRLLQDATVPAIFHGFVKNPALADTLVAQGFYLSFGAALTKGQKNAIDSLASVPENRFFLETDHSEQNVKTIYKAAAAIRGITDDALVAQLHENYNAVFKR